MSEKLKLDVENLSQPGTRKIGSQGHAAARAYLTQRLSGLNLETYADQSYELPYQIGEDHFTNIAAILPGEHRELNPILLIAHYDTCGDQPGADDNAAAIAIWLDVVERLSQQSGLMRDLIILFPDAEEPPNFLTQYMGSTNFYQNQLRHKLHCGLVLDLVGHDVPVQGLEELIFIFGAESHPQWEQVLLATDLPPGLKNIATLNRYVGDLSDHHILRENSEAYLFLSCGRWEHYHAETDLPEHLNYTKMQFISDYLYDLLGQIDARKLSQYLPEHDPIQMEIDLLDRAVGPYLKEHGIVLNDRNDVQKFVLSWVKQFEL